MNMPELLELRDAVTRLCADHNLHFQDPAWAMISEAFDWNDSWPAVDRYGRLDGAVVNPANEDYATTSCNLAVIDPHGARSGGWTIDDEGFAFIPEKYKYRR